jgi:hypothetical protein
MPKAVTSTNQRQSLFTTREAQLHDLEIKIENKKKELAELIAEFNEKKSLKE